MSQKLDVRRTGAEEAMWILTPQSSISFYHLVTFIEEFMSQNITFKKKYHISKNHCFGLVLGFYRNKLNRKWDIVSLQVFGAEQGSSATMLGRSVRGWTRLLCGRDWPEHAG